MYVCTYLGRWQEMFEEECVMDCFPVLILPNAITLLLYDIFPDSSGGKKSACNARTSV